MSPRFVRMADLVPTSWPNGKGVTRDVAGRTRPDGSMDWLISIAELGSDAPFSHFDDCDRHFTLVSGEGVQLSIGDAPAVSCRPLVPIFFRGDIPTRCRITAGPARAFNLFARRLGQRPTVWTLHLAGYHEIRLQSALAVHCGFGSVRVRGDLMGPGDTLVDSEGEEFAAGAEGAGLVIVRW